MAATIKSLSAFLLLTLCLSSCSFLTTRSEEKANAKIFAELAKLPEVPAFEGDLFMIFAHADDELLTLSYIAKVHRSYPNKAIHWILVSNSAEGFMFPTSCGDKDPATCRFDEAKAVAKCIDIAAPINMKLPDGELKQLAKLDVQIEKVVKKISRGKVGAILTSDPTGVYGHPDHLTVHDAVKKLTTRNQWRMITGALPKPFREKIDKGKEAKDRVDPPVTHVEKIDGATKEQLVCAIKAHKSQRIVLWALRQGLSPVDFIEKIPLQFFNYQD